jgi:hypothetical protein
MTTNIKPVAIQSFGAVPVKYDGAWYSLFVAQVARRLNLLSGPYTVQPQLLLQSPDGKAWKITISNSGVLNTPEEVQRGDVLPPI